ncbi:MAG: DUF192 domain-containing protein [Cyanobacteria bacterium HKST-UBA06]|nr:DUF192 domain-containing protein [Cyanobacteria bacterium HKST-UBA04]MCA9807091.1 DUF192 domain-containing protein [Cyanobacteria bacterium HKST-UBA06]
MQGGWSKPPCPNPAEQVAAVSATEVAVGLPVTTIVLDDHPFTVEVARTMPEQNRGLQHRTSLAQNRGMLFEFDRPYPLRFWMKDTLIPLDILFFKNDVLIHVVENALPCKADPCPVYATPAPADRVVELNAGTSQRLGFSPRHTHLSYTPLSYTP